MAVILLLLLTCVIVPHDHVYSGVATFAGWAPIWEVPEGGEDAGSEPDRVDLAGGVLIFEWVLLGLLSLAVFRLVNEVEAKHRPQWSTGRRRRGCRSRKATAGPPS